MRAMEDAIQLACNEIKKIAKEEELSEHDLDILDKAAHTVKSLMAVMAMKDDEKYSYASGQSRRYSSYDGGMSGRRGSGRRRGYSYADAKDDMIEQLENMREMVQSKTDQEAIDRCIRQLEDDD